MTSSMNWTNPFLDANGDKLREECGVFGAMNATDAAALTALGLHALQHRGQEAAGITSYDGAEFFSRRGLGHVAENFSSSEAIADLPGTMAAGHVRYSTTGGAGLRNVQPLYADLAGFFYIGRYCYKVFRNCIFRGLLQKPLPYTIRIT